ncbi:nucleoporin protein Ndc1-Nup [Durotheca rogersii]|uniref:nucleoporin protein Ndc1-Nup n=1 Tax=Durotheca rogersii TaxID=419775 RepID=UPI00221FCA14|nr:nucleoporin protein Ndc1-Nup [Durotheca rogersii]KAI5860416.1 nucleoporin protein Ndc1-Nup [Durotheca rogersii]
MPPAVARRSPYKDFLQPALQRRFASTAGVLLAISYVEALTLSSWSSLVWSWLPLGLPGLRTLVIFGSIFPIIILRIAHAHIGIRTSNSPFETFCNNAISFATLETIVTFAFSAWLFSQTYLLSTPDEANLRWVTHYSGDRVRLNERALFYTMNLVVLGIVQGVLHVALDFDQMLLGIVRPRREGEANTQSLYSFERLGEWAPVLVVRAGVLSIAVALANYVLVYHFFRRSAWGWAMSFFRLFYNLPKTNIPPSQAPWSIWMLGRSMWAGFLLTLLWYFGDMAFRLQLGRPPLKNNQPLSAESKDPNGSLLNGLKSKKSRISAFAVWETALIARDFDVRRAGIFEDIDRNDGPTWSQVYVTCLSMIKEIEQRIDNYGKPPTPPPAPPANGAPPQQPPQPPTRIVQPPRSDDVWAPAPAPKSVRNSVGKLVINLATSPGKPPLGALVPEAKRRALEAREQLLSKEQQEALTSDGLSAMARGVMDRVLSTPTVGLAFQQLFGRRLTTAVLGRPYGELSVYANAAYVLSRLAVCSLTEDAYGKVQRDVPAIIRTFTMVIKKIERFRDGFPFHWTDLRRSRECPEVEELLAALKDGLGELIAAFGPFSTDLRLTRADMRLAREAAEQRQAAAPAEAEPARDAAAEAQRPEMRELR